MSNSTGQAILSAYKFIHEVHHDTLSLIHALDSRMNHMGWYPNPNNKVSEVLSNRMFADRWLLPAVYRLYAKGEEETSTTQFIAILVDFEPPESYDEPVCLGLAIRLESEETSEKIWNAWDAGDGSQKLLAHLAGKLGLQSVPKSLFRGLLSRAAEIDALVVPLCGLKSEQLVKEHLVDPILTSQLAQ